MAKGVSRREGTISASCCCFACSDVATAARSDQKDAGVATLTHEDEAGAGDGEGAGVGGAGVGPASQRVQRLQLSHDPHTAQEQFCHDPGGPLP